MLKALIISNLFLAGVIIRRVVLRTRNHTAMMNRLKYGSSLGNTTKQGR